jgi:hypothetical protein
METMEPAVHRHLFGIATWQEGRRFAPFPRNKMTHAFLNNIDDWLFISHLCDPFTPAILYFKISRKVIRAHCRQALLLFNIRPPAFQADSSAM